MADMGATNIGPGEFSSELKMHTDQKRRKVLHLKHPEKEFYDSKCVKVILEFNTLLYVVDVFQSQKMV